MSVSNNNIIECGEKNSNIMQRQVITDRVCARLLFNHHPQHALNQPSSPTAIASIHFAFRSDHQSVCFSIPHCKKFAYPSFYSVETRTNRIRSFGEFSVCLSSYDNLIYLPFMQVIFLFFGFFIIISKSKCSPVTYGR